MYQYNYLFLWMVAVNVDSLPRRNIETDIAKSVVRKFYSVVWLRWADERGTEKC